MSNPPALSGATHACRPDWPILLRVPLAAFAIVGLMVSSPGGARGQEPLSPAKTWELRFPSGAFVPTGDHRDAIKDAQLTAVQVAWAVRPRLAITGSIAWARSRDLVSVDAPRLDVFTSDLGLEVRSDERFSGRGASFTAFAGAGGGVRSFNHRRLDEDATHHLAGYGAVGGELTRGRVGLRLEVRDYIAGFRPIVRGDGLKVRNDLAITAALRIGRRLTSGDTE